MTMIAATKFSLKLTILTFGTKFYHFRSKKKKVNTIIEFCIFELVQESSFAINWQYGQFGPNLPKISLKFNDAVHFFCFWPEIPFLSKFGPKNVELDISTWYLDLILWIPTSRIQWECSPFSFLIRYSVFGWIWSKMSKLSVQG